MGNDGHAPALPILCGFASVSHTVACARTNKSECLSKNEVFRQSESLPVPGRLYLIPLSSFVAIGKQLHHQKSNWKSQNGRNKIGQLLSQPNLLNQNKDTQILHKKIWQIAERKLQRGSPGRFLVKGEISIQ